MVRNEYLSQLDFFFQKIGLGFEWGQGDKVLIYFRFNWLYFYFKIFLSFMWI